MAEFVPKDKMSKKAQKEMNRQRRKTWEFSPVTRIADSKKRYNRKKRTHDRYGDYGTGSFFYAFARMNPGKYGGRIHGCGIRQEAIE